MVLCPANTPALPASTSPMDLDGLDRVSQSLSPGAATRNADLRLPATCEPPSDANPPKRAVWIVRLI